MGDNVSNIIPFDQHRMLQAALAYAAKGWHVLPCFRPKKREDGKVLCGCNNLDCATPGKHPHGFLARRGQYDATTNADIIRRWFAYGHDLNIAIELSKSGLVAIDIDPRNGGEITKEKLEQEYGPLYSDVEAITGGGGQHYVYSSPHGVSNLPGKLGPGVDLKGNGYIVVWPSLHMSGAEYEWEASSDPTEGAVPSPCPDWLRDLSVQRQGAITHDTTTYRSRYVDAEQVEDLRSALTAIPADDYHTWVNVGNALKSIGAVGFDLWDTWSKTSDKYVGHRQGPKWRSFKVGSFQLESIFHLAQSAGWANPASVVSEPISAPKSIDTIAVYQPPPERPTPATKGITLPGVLGEAEAWINATSRKPQPDFATQAALAFGATVLGRRYRTDQNNFPSLYFLNIGKSASGKEHAKWAIEELLEACDLAQLIGPAGYTSDSGVLSALVSQPTHISIVDEFGKVLEGASIKHNARPASTIKTLMEVWGRCHGTVRPQGYSTFGLTPAEQERLAAKCVRHPALTLLAMSTPETLFEGVGSAAARDGFLNRFLIVETDIGRQVSQPVPARSVPTAVIDWAKRHTVQRGLISADNATLVPDLIEIPIDKAAQSQYTAFEHRCIHYMDTYDQHGMAEMFGRSVEIAMRVGLVLAVGCDARSVTGDMAEQAIEYVETHAKRTIERLIVSMADSEFEACCNQVLEIIRQSRDRGMTERELYQRSRKYRALDKRGRLNIMASLEQPGQIARAEVPTPGGRGRKRLAWVATAPETDDNNV